MLRAASLAALALLAALVAACGGGAAAGEADPASAVPADALVYIEAVVRPEGDLRDDALAAAGKVLRTDDPVGQDLASSSTRRWPRRTRHREARLRQGHRAVARRARRRLVRHGSTATVIPAGAVLVAITDQDAALDAVDKGDARRAARS